MATNKRLTALDPIDLPLEDTDLFYVVRETLTLTSERSRSVTFLDFSQQITSSISGGPTIQVEGLDVSDQSIINFIAGDNVTVSNPSAGNIVIQSFSTSTGGGGPTIEVNGVPVSNQSVINFQDGSNIDITNPSLGNIVITSTATGTGSATIFQVNTVTISSSATVNFVQGNNVTITNPSNGIIMIESSGGGGGGSGGNMGLEFIDKHICSVDETSFTFSGLDGDVDCVYFYTFRVKNNSGSTANYSIKPNNLATNQYTRRFVVANGGTVNDTFTYLYIASLINADMCSGKGWIYAAKNIDGVALKREFESTFAGDGAVGSATGQSTVVCSGTWNETSANLSSIVFFADQTGAWGEGSEVVLYKYAQIAGAGGGGGDFSYYTYLAAQLEPLAIETLKSGAFSYAIGAAETKLIVNAFATRLGSGGRWEIRDPRSPIPLRNVTLTGLTSSGTGVVIDPSLPVYSDAQSTYFARLQELATTGAKYVQISTGNTTTLFLPGPYGNIITSVNVFDATWLIVRPNGSGTLGWNLHDENGDAAAEALRVAHSTMIPISKNVASLLELGTQRSGGDAEGSITHIILPSTWGEVADPNTYIFSDDFMAATLDTATKWTRTESTSGNMQIDTTWQWLKWVGNNNWGTNGIFSQTTTSRVTGKKFEIDVLFTANGANDGGIVGWHDGSGVSFSDMSHGLNFNQGNITVFENGTSRGNVGTGWTTNTIYRIRITLNGNAAIYEIQGGSQYQPIGGSAWTDITPGTTSSSTTPLAIGIVPFGNTQYASYAKMISN